MSGKTRWTCDNSVEVLLMDRKWLIVRGTGKARCIPERRESWLVGGITSWKHCIYTRYKAGRSDIWGQRGWPASEGKVRTPWLRGLVVDL